MKLPGYRTLLVVVVGGSSCMCIPLPKNPKRRSIYGEGFDVFLISANGTAENVVLEVWALGMGNPGVLTYQFYIESYMCMYICTCIHAYTM